MIPESLRSKNHFYAKVVEHSINDYGIPLITGEWRFPRVILAEINTHRMMSKNSASSRAIPFHVSRPERLRKPHERPSMLEMVEETPYYPIFWGKNQPGMQAWEELSGDQLTNCVIDYQAAIYDACRHATNLWKNGLHKQDCNRIIEPFAWCTQVISATDWSNMFALRTHKDAHPAFQWAARLLFAAIKRSSPKLLKPGEWHLPYVTAEERTKYPIDDLKAMSAIRCARVSYINQDGATDRDNDMKLYYRLAGATPKHMSPFEHVATPSELYASLGRDSIPGNFCGYKQYRCEFANENILTFDPSEEELIEWGVW